MGRLYLDVSGSEYDCANCGILIARRAALIRRRCGGAEPRALRPTPPHPPARSTPGRAPARSFHGRGGPAYLFSATHNTRLGPLEDRTLSA